MSSQLIIKASRSQPIRSARKATAFNSINLQSPKTAGRNARASGLKTLSQGRNSQLPVPVSGVATKTKRNSSSSNKAGNGSSQLSPIIQPALKKVKKNNHEKKGEHQLSATKKSDARADNTNISNLSPNGRSTSSIDVHLTGASTSIQPVVLQGDDSIGSSAPDNSQDNHIRNSNPDSQGQSPPVSHTNELVHSPILSPHAEGGNVTADTELTDPPASNLPPSKPSDPWHLAFNELKSMGAELRSMSKRMDKFENIEKEVGSLKSKVDLVSGRTKDLNDVTQGLSEDVNSMKSNISSVKSAIRKHDSSLEQLSSHTNEIASMTDQRIREIKQVIGETIDRIGKVENSKEEIKKEVSMQIDEGLKAIKEELRNELQNEMKKEISVQVQQNAQSTKSELQDEIKKSAQDTKDEMQGVITGYAHDAEYKRLQTQANNNSHNLVLIGIPEHDQDSAYTQASRFFKNKLKLSKLSIDVAYRLGKLSNQDSSYSRPIVVKFSYVADRHTVWAKRNNIPNDGQATPIRIQADIPKQLREDLQILYRVQRAAQNIPQYQTAEVKNYKLYLNGEEYSAWELEELPMPLRPSTLATRKSDNALVFYSKYSALSNHHYSPFEIKGRSFANMEHYLAYKRAKLSGRKDLINKALLAQDPVEAKAILNILREDHYDEWKKDLSTITTEGLHAKFKQNKEIGDYLRSTAPLTLGEASKNSQWGIGFTLDQESVLDKAKWNKKGNLLGRLLTKVRNQMINESQNQAAARVRKTAYEGNTSSAQGTPPSQGK